MTQDVEIGGQKMVAGDWVGQIAIGGLVRTFPKMQLAGEPTRRDQITLPGLAHLPVALAG